MSITKKSFLPLDEFRPSLQSLWIVIIKAFIVVTINFTAWFTSACALYLFDPIVAHFCGRKNWLSGCILRLDWHHSESRAFLRFRHVHSHSRVGCDVLVRLIGVILFILGIGWVSRPRLRSVWLWHLVLILSSLIFSFYHIFGGCNLVFSEIFPPNVVRSATAHYETADEYA